MTNKYERVDLPDGEWAEIRDPAKTPERLRRPVREAAIDLQRSMPEDQRRGTVKVDAPRNVADDEVRSAFGAPPIDDLVADNTPDENALAYLPTSDQQKYADLYNEALLLSVITSWSYENDVTIQGVRDLPGDAYDELLDTVRKFGAVGESDSLADDPSAPSVS